MSAALVSIAFASEPGERLTADDIHLAIPRLTAETFLEPLEPGECSTLTVPNVLQCARSFPDSRLDASGHLYFPIHTEQTWELWRTRRDGVTELVAQIPRQRDAPFGTVDLAELGGFYVDNVNGLVYVRLTTRCSPQPTCEYSTAHEIIRIRGLERLRGPGRPH
jgi:hypothetical protein